MSGCGCICCQLRQASRLQWLLWRITGNRKWLPSGRGAAAIETLREWLPALGATSVPAEPIKPKQAREIHEAVAAVEALLEAAKLAGTHVRHSRGCAIYELPWLGRRTSGSPSCTCGVDDLRAAIRRVEAGQ